MSNNKRFENIWKYSIIGLLPILFVGEKSANKSSYNSPRTRFVPNNSFEHFPTPNISHFSLNIKRKQASCLYAFANRKHPNYAQQILQQLLLREDKKIHQNWVWNTPWVFFFFYEIAWGILFSASPSTWRRWTYNNSLFYKSDCHTGYCFGTRYLTLKSCRIPIFLDELNIVN